MMENGENMHEHLDDFSIQIIQMENIRETKEETNKKIYISDSKKSLDGLIR